MTLVPSCKMLQVGRRRSFRHLLYDVRRQGRKETLVFPSCIVKVAETVQLHVGIHASDCWHSTARNRPLCAAACDCPSVKRRGSANT